MQSIINGIVHWIGAGISNVIWTVVTVLIGPTIIMLLVKRFVPVLGEQMWRLYCDLLMFLFRLPVWMVRALAKEISSRRRGRPH